MSESKGCALGRTREEHCPGDVCSDCGWYGPEAVRRAALPLVTGADGKRRKIVSKRKPEIEPQ